MNALHFPMPEVGFGSLKFSTDSMAWLATKGARGCMQEEEPPMVNIQWGLVAIKGALSFFHLDSNGFNTYIESRTEFKWCILGGGPGENFSFESIGDMQTYFNGTYDKEKPNTSSGKMKLEVILLAPGTRL